MQVLLLPVGRGLTGPYGTHERDVTIGGRVPVRCDLWPRQVPWRLWQEVKGEAMAAAYSGVIVWTVERQRRCEVCVVVRMWCCSAHTGNEVSSCVGGVAEKPWRTCVACCAVFFVGLFVVFRLTSGGQSSELGSLIAWGRGCCCCGCGLPPPFRPSFENIELLALAATPLWQE